MLQPLLLLGVPLRQLLCLLLMPLFELLFPGFIRILSCELLVFLFLLLLQFLPFFLLLREQFFLLLLVLPIQFGIPSIWRTGALGRRQLVRMHRGSPTRVISPRPRRRIMNRTRPSRRHNSAFVKCSRFRSSGDWRLAPVFGSP